MGTQTQIVHREREERQGEKGGDRVRWGSDDRWIEITGVGADEEESSDSRSPLVDAEGERDREQRAARRNED